MGGKAKKADAMERWGDEREVAGRGVCENGVGRRSSVWKERLSGKAR